MQNNPFKLLLHKKRQNIEMAVDPESNFEGCTVDEIYQDVHEKIKERFQAMIDTNPDTKYTFYGKKLLQVIQEYVDAGISNDSNLQLRMTLAQGIRSQSGFQLLTRGSNSSITIKKTDELSLDEFKKNMVNVLQSYVNLASRKVRFSVPIEVSQYHAAIVSLLSGGYDSYELKPLETVESDSLPAFTTLLVDKKYQEIHLAITNCREFFELKLDFFKEAILGSLAAAGIDNYSWLDKYAFEQWNNLKHSMFALTSNTRSSLFLASQKHIVVETAEKMAAEISINKPSKNTPAPKAPKQEENDGLATIDNPDTKNQETASEKKPKAKVRSKLNIEVSPDRQQAKIVNWNMKLYDENVDEEWLRAELQKHKIAVDLFEENLKTLGNLMLGNLDLSGEIVAEGQAPEPGIGPFIEEYRENVIPDASEENLDIRNNQFSQLVKPGTVIARVGYEEPAVIGYDVYGKETRAQQDDFDFIIDDESIEVHENQTFSAKIWGVPQITNNSVAIDKAYLHEGDVNLSSGNITFDGPVHVTGSVDVGSTIKCSGNLRVEGIISSSATVHCGGDLVMGDGINMGNKGIIVVKGNLTTPYIENSTIICHGDMAVGKVILNSNISVGGNLRFTQKAATISGGAIFCQKSISTFHLGMDNQVPSEIHFGCDWLLIRKIYTMRVRVEKMADIRADLKTLIRKAPSKATKPKEGEEPVLTKAEISEKLTRLRLIIEKVESKIADLKANLNFDRDAYVMVDGTYWPHVKVYFGEKIVPVRDAAQEVVFFPISEKRAQMISKKDFLQNQAG